MWYPGKLQYGRGTLLLSFPPVFLSLEGDERENGLKIIRESGKPIYQKNQISKQQQNQPSKEMTCGELVPQGNSVRLTFFSPLEI